MSRLNRLSIRTALAALVTVIARPSTAQQVTGVSGSPGATTTIDGRAIPGTTRNSAG